MKGGLRTEKKIQIMMRMTMRMSERMTMMPVMRMKTTMNETIPVLQRKMAWTQTKTRIKMMAIKKKRKTTKKTKKMAVKITRSPVAPRKQ